MLVVVVVLAGGWFLLDDTYEVDLPSDRDVGLDRTGLARDAIRDLEKAVLTRDRAVAPAGAGYVVANARRLRVRDFSMRYVDEISATPDAPGWTVSAATSWRFGRAQRRTAHAEVALHLTTRNGRVRVKDVGGADRRSPLWLAAPVRVVRGSDVLVLGVVERAALQRVAERAGRAVQVVRRVLPDWRSTLVVVVPGSAEQLTRVLNAEAGRYDTIAAVTATADGKLTPASPVQVFLNPEEYLGLERLGSQVVMSHEATHVATGAVLSEVPLWLLEGFADYVALRDVELSVQRAAGKIIERVREKGVPHELPSPSDFDTRQERLGATYEAAWLACRELVEAGGEEALVELYRRVDEGAGIDDAMRQVFGFATPELTRRWQERLREIAGVG